MDNKNTGNRIHPLMAAAAVSVMLVSLTGVAAMTGLLPVSHGTPAPASTPTVTAPASPSSLASSLGTVSAATSPAALVEPKTEAPIVEAQQEAPAPAPQSSTPSYKAAQTSTGHSYAQNSVAQAPVCHSCGRIESIEAIRHTPKTSGVGVVAGGVIGGLLGNQVGHGNGRALATVAGAVGGGYAGNEVERRTHTTVTYQVRVRMDNGKIRTFPYAQQPGWVAGDRVRVVNGHLAARA